MFSTMEENSPALMTKSPIRHLVVFPGLSSPYGPVSPTYELLSQRASDLGITLTLALYPGQQLQNGDCVGELTANAAFEAATLLLRKVASHGGGVCHLRTRSHNNAGLSASAAIGHQP